jgi:hypothetical protein
MWIIADNKQPSAPHPKWLTVNTQQTQRNFYKQLRSLICAKTSAYLLNIQSLPIRQYPKRGVKVKKCDAPSAKRHVIASFTIKQQSVLKAFSNPLCAIRFIMSLGRWVVKSEGETK